MEELFTVEEINLMCIFNTNSRNELIFELIDAITDFEDDELFEIAQNALNKVSKMSDADFAALDFYPVYDDDDDETEVDT
jgi:hypothetical protein